MVSLKKIYQENKSFYNSIIWLVPLALVISIPSWEEHKANSRQECQNENILIHIFKTKALGKLHYLETSDFYDLPENYEDNLEVIIQEIMDILKQDGLSDDEIKEIFDTTKTETIKFKEFSPR